MTPSPTWPLSATRAKSSTWANSKTVNAVAMSDVPVLAFGAGLTALGVLRSLAGSGITVYSVCPPGDLATRSRWYRPVPTQEARCPEPGELSTFLERLPLSRAVLIPCSDDWVRAIAELPPELQPRFPASVPEPRVVDTMTDKWRFSTLLDCVDVARPITIRVESMAELCALPEDSFRNMFLKPIDSQEFSRRNHAKAFRVQHKQHAIHILQRVLDDGGYAFPILLQEYIPGGADAYFLVDGFVDRRGIPKAWIARRRLSQYPPHFGNSSRSQTIPLTEVKAAVDALEKIWSRVRYRGIFDAEFKYDERDGQFKILEINARPWWFVEFATRCNVDLCKMAYQDALELPVDGADEYEIGRCCVHLAYDLAAHLDGRFTPGRFFSWARSCRGIEDIIYRWDDPWPGLRSTLSSLKRRGLRGLVAPVSTAPAQSPHPQVR